MSKVFKEVNIQKDINNILKNIINNKDLENNVDLFKEYVDNLDIDVLLYLDMDLANIIGRHKNLVSDMYQHNMLSLLNLMYYITNRRCNSRVFRLKIYDIFKYLYDKTENKDFELLLHIHKDLYDVLDQCWIKKNKEYIFYKLFVEKKGNYDLFDKMINLYDKDFIDEHINLLYLFNNLFSNNLMEIYKFYDVFKYLLDNDKITITSKLMKNLYKYEKICKYYYDFIFDDKIKIEFLIYICKNPTNIKDISKHCCNFIKRIINDLILSGNENEKIDSENNILLPDEICNSNILFNICNNYKTNQLTSSKYLRDLIILLMEYGVTIEYDGLLLEDYVSNETLCRYTSSCFVLKYLFDNYKKSVMIE